MCKTRINNSIEKRKSVIENIYNCGNEHNCDTNTQQKNSFDFPATPTTTSVDGIIHSCLTYIYFHLDQHFLSSQFTQMLYNLNLIQLYQPLGLNRYQPSLISTHFLKQSIHFNAFIESLDINIILRPYFIFFNMF